MEIRVNRRRILLFEGAQVKHAVLKYFKARKLDESEMENVEVHDVYGHVIDHDAPLQDHDKISFKIPKP